MRLPRLVYGKDDEGVEWLVNLNDVARISCASGRDAADGGREADPARGIEVVWASGSKLPFNGALAERIWSAFYAGAFDPSAARDQS